MYDEVRKESDVEYIDNSADIPKKILDTIIVGDSRKMEEIPDNSVHLIVTSPPYNVTKEYDEDLTLSEYLQLLRDVFQEAWRVLVTGGRVAINISNVGRKPYISLHMHIQQIMLDIGFLMRADIIWNKQTFGSSCAWGCYDALTRVVTNNGIKYFRDVDLLNDKFATMNPRTRKVEYQSATNYIEQYYNGDMYYIKNKTLDMSITPNHNMLIWNLHKKDIEFKRMDNIARNFSIPQGSAGCDGVHQPIFIIPDIEYSDINVIDIKKSNTYHIRKESVSRIPYSGNVYCVTVPNHTLLVERNGKFTWCGNSFQNASNPCMRDVHEYIVVFSKQKFKREGSGKNTIGKSNFMDWTRSIWNMNTESAKRLGQPAPFPEELPGRLIELYSFEGDVILDPFMGSGTTGLAALKRNRHFLGYELDQKYATMATKRVRAWKGQHRMSEYFK